MTLNSTKNLWRLNQTTKYWKQLALTMSDFKDKIAIVVDSLMNWPKTKIIKQWDLEFLAIRKGKSWVYTVTETTGKRLFSRRRFKI